MRTSRRFLRLAQNCILFIEVPVEWLLQFRNLRGTGDLVRIPLDSETIPLLAQLPFLVEGNFVLWDIPLVDLVDDSRLLSSSQSGSEADEGQLQILAIQLDSYFASGSLTQALPQPLLRTYPILQYISPNLDILTHLSLFSEDLSGLR